MNEESWDKFVDEARKSYYKIGAVECPAFGGQKVHFNKYGWSHIVRKNGKLRSVEQQKRRILLIPHAVTVVKTSIIWTKHRNADNEVRFWSLEKKIGKKIIIVIVRQNTEQKFFFSIMDSKNTKGPY